MTADNLKLYFVVGEASGDELGADLITQFKKLNKPVSPLGLGGLKMRALGLEPLFDSSEIAMMGISAVIGKLPSILARGKQVANDIIEKKPDIVLLIDSPEFAKLVAKRVKRKCPDLPVVKYVCPSVWAWRPGRAAKMNAYLDHVLAILPFEPQVMRELGGPPTTYVGHPLAVLAGKTDLTKRQTPKKKPQILLLPGSRNSEVSRLLPILKDTITLLEDRGLRASYYLPAVPHLESKISQAIENWPVKPELVIGEAEKINSMKRADAAIAASGTALLELAIYGVPTISIYKADPAFNAVRFLIKAWTGALPNLITDQVIIPERINEFAHPGYIARLLEAIARKGPERQSQLDGFQLMYEKMQQKQPTGKLVAKIILDLTGKT